MQALVSGADLEPLRTLVSAWQRELATMPPGCFGLRLDEYLRSSDDIARFARLMSDVIKRLRDDPERPKTLEEALRIRDFIQSQNAEPGASPNGGPATPLDNSEVAEGPPSVS